MSHRKSAGVDDCPCFSILFIAVIPILIIKLQFFPYTCLFTFLLAAIILVSKQVPLQKKERP